MIKLKIKYGNSQTDLRFPCTEKEMNAALERIHAEDVTPLELYVSEVIFPEELGCLQDRFVNLDEVNFLAKRMAYLKNIRRSGRKNRRQRKMPTAAVRHSRTVKSMNRRHTAAAETEVLLSAHRRRKKKLLPT